MRRIRLASVIAFVLLGSGVSFAERPAKKNCETGKEVLLWGSARGAGCECPAGTRTVVTKSRIGATLGRCEPRSERKLCEVDKEVVLWGSARGAGCTCPPKTKAVVTKSAKGSTKGKCVSKGSDKQQKRCPINRTVGLWGSAKGAGCKCPEGTTAKLTRTWKGGSEGKCVPPDKTAGMLCPTGKEVLLWGSAKGKACECPAGTRTVVTKSYRGGTRGRCEPREGGTGRKKCPVNREVTLWGSARGAGCDCPAGTKRRLTKSMIGVTRGKCVRTRGQPASP
jgi:hypothetical protein